MKKVLFVLSTGLVNGGVPNVTLQIVKYFHKYYMFDIVVSGLDPAELDDEFTYYGGNIYRVPKIGYNNNKFSILKNGHAIYNTVLDKCIKNQYDIIHCENGFEGGPALHAAYIAGVPVRISHAHGTYLIRGKNIVANAYKWKCKLEINRYTTARIACSQKSGNSLFQDKFINILNPIDTEYYKSIAKIKHSGINLLQIGYFCRLKNQLFSLRLLTEILKVKKDVKLYLIGFETETGYLEKLKRFITENNIEQNVFFLEPRTPKDMIFPTIDYLLLPSTSEGLPLTALEAQSSNIMALVSDVVTDEVDLGLCRFIALNDMAKWQSTIIDNIGYSIAADNTKVDRISISDYMNSIGKIYSDVNIHSVNKN